MKDNTTYTASFTLTQLAGTVSHSLLFDPKYVSKLKSCGVSMLDAGSEILPPALQYLGKDPFSNNSADMTRLLFIILSWIELS